MRYIHMYIFPVCIYVYMYVHKNAYVYTHICILIYDTCAWTSDSVSKTSLQAYLGANFASETIHVATGARFTCTCYSIASGLHGACLGPTFANEQIIWLIALGLLGPTLGLPLPTRKSLGLLFWAYSGVPLAYLCRRANH